MLLLLFYWSLFIVIVFSLLPSSGLTYCGLWEFVYWDLLGQPFLGLFDQKCGRCGRRVTRMDYNLFRLLLFIAFYCTYWVFLRFIGVYHCFIWLYCSLFGTANPQGSGGFGGLLPFILAVFFKLSRFDEKWSTRPHSMTNANMAKAMGPDKEQ